MGLFGNILLAFIHLLLVAVDLVIAAAIVRLLAGRWPISWLQAADTACRPLTDQMLSVTRRCVPLGGHVASREATWLGIWLLFILMIRFMLGSMV